MSNHSSLQDEYFMKLALSHAKRGLGCTFPNPSVGAVIVKNGHIIAAGNTAKGGRPHAEIVALEQAGKAAEGAVMYVTLEPCCHTGVTPPCTEALIAARLERVVIATQDPNPQVCGQGIMSLKKTGISVTYGVCEEEAKVQNAGFFLNILEKRPFITLKLATSLDGKIASSTGKSTWITGALARDYGHLLRAQHDAIMVGVGTALADNPSLTCRLPGLEERSPIRVIMDSNLRLPLSSNLTDTLAAAPVWVIACHDHGKEAHKHALIEAGIEVIEVDRDNANHADIHQALAVLSEAGITRLLLEGGGQLAATCIKAGRVDALVWMRAAMALGGDGVAAIGGLSVDELAAAPRWKRQASRMLGQDMLEIYRN